MMHEPNTIAATTGDLARRLYQVYSEHAGWKDYRGEPLPTFDDMRPETKAHWVHVAEDLCIYGIDSAVNMQRINETMRPLTPPAT